MKILVTGATGLVGTTLVRTLESAGHEVWRASRRASTGGRSVQWDPQNGVLDATRLSGLDAAVHLAGESIASGRWTDEKKKVLLESRTLSTKLLGQTLAALTPLPKVLVSASAVGFYGGDRGDEVLDEGSAMGEGFLAEICRDWEAETRYAHRAGIRTVQTRFGIVLSKDGGALPRMLLPFKLGLGGRLGSGKQYMSFVSLEDVVAAIVFALTNESLAGPINVVAPNPVTNAEFTKALGRALHRPTLFPAPEFAIKLLLGEMGEQLLLGGQRVVPKRLLDAGFSFRHATIDAALAAILSH